MSKDSAPGKANSIVTFSEEYEQGSDNYIIFQVDDQFLKSLNDSKKLEIQALKMEDKAILITNDKTFSIQRREYSNTFLYTKQKNMEENQKNLEIIASKSSVLELLPHKPEYENLYKAFYDNRLKAEDPMNQESIGFTLDHIKNNFTISKSELAQFLKRIDACCNDERWFIIDESYLISVFHEILYYYSSQNLTDHKIVYEELLQSNMIDKPSFVVLKSLQRFSESDSSVSEPRIFNLTYQKICEMLIKELLLTKESYIFHEFRQLFEKMIETFCPRSLYEKYTEEEKSNIEFTKFFQTGFVLDDNILSGNQYNFQRIVIKKIDRGYFPSEFKTRLEYLFNLKKRYFHEELHNWFSDMFSNTKELDEILLKNTRTIQEKLSKTSHPGFISSFKPFINNVVQDNNSSSLCYYVRFYVSKY